MNTVNIRTVPIKSIHQGGLEVMRKKDMTREKKSKKENTGHKALGDETSLQAKKKRDGNLKQL